jgi:hypothetical protein
MINQRGLPMVTEKDLPTAARWEVYDKLSEASIHAFMNDMIDLTKAILGFQDFILENDMSDEDFTNEYYEYYRTLISKAGF